MLTALLLALFIGLFILLMLIIFLGPSILKGDIGKSCTIDTDCLHGLSCEQNICKSQLDGPCSGINDCVSSATSCFKNRCVGTPLGNVGDPAPCNTGLVPEYNICKVMVNGACNGNGDCVTSLNCVNDICIAGPVPPTLIRQVKPEIRPTAVPVKSEHISLSPSTMGMSLINKMNMGHPLEEERVRRQKELEAEQEREDKERIQVLEREEAERVKVEPTYTLVAMEPLQKKYKDLFPNNFNVTSAAMFGKYIVVTNDKGDVKIYDAEKETFMEILIKDKMKSLTLVNGFVTGLTLEGQVVQFRNETIHKDNSIEWASTPLHIKGRIIASSPDGRYTAIISGKVCNIYDTNTDSLILEKSLEFEDSTKDIILGYNLKNIITVTDKGLQINGERYLQARSGCFTPDGRFATIPLTADHIKKSYIFNEITHHIVDRAQLHRLLE